MSEAVTLLALLAALACAIIGALGAFNGAGPTQLQDVVQALAIVAAATAIYANRRATSNERRSLALGALSEEFAHNAGVLEDHAFEPMTGSEPARVYPRIVLSAVDAALASSALSTKRDVALVRDLHSWRNAAQELNRRLDLAETIAFVTAGVPTTARELDAGLHLPAGHLERVRASLRTTRELYLSRG